MLVTFSTLVILFLVAFIMGMVFGISLISSRRTII